MKYFLRFFKVGVFVFFAIVLGKNLFAQNFGLDSLQQSDSLKDSEENSPYEGSSILPSKDLPELISVPKVLMQGLDKITGRVLTIETSVGKSINFGRLKIVVHRCYKAPPEEIPEAIVDIDIFEKTALSGEEVLIFRNKMYASSPAVSALDHPIYDIWVKDCF